MTVPFDDARKQAYLPQWTAAPVEVSIGSSTARSSQLGVGYYLLRSTTSVHIKQGNSTSDATTSDFIMGSGVVYPMEVTDTDANGYLSGIQVSAAGTLQILKMQAG